MSKELFMKAHEQLIEEYLEEHPEANEDEAYEKTADKAYLRMGNNLADMGDRLRERMKDNEI